MKIITWNVNGIRAIEKKGDLNELLKKYKPDILCLQETKANPEQLAESLKDKPGYVSYFNWPTERKGYAGTAIYTKLVPLKVTQNLGFKNFIDDEGRTLVAEYKDFYLLNCYFPNGGRDKEQFQYKLVYYEKFLELARKLEKKKPVIFCGDVNSTATDFDLARPKENEGHVGCTPEERAWIAKWKIYFLDIWRFKYPKKQQWTWWDMKTHARARDIGWRIDYFFISKSLEKKVKKIQILDQVYGSDHCPVELEIDL